MVGTYVVVQYYISCHIMLVSGYQSQEVAYKVTKSPVEQVMNTQAGVMVLMKDCKLNSHK